MGWVGWDGSLCGATIGASLCDANNMPLSNMIVLRGYDYIMKNNVGHNTSMKRAA